MITGYDHVQIAIPAGSEDAARAFYGTLLGMTELPKPPVLAARGGCWFSSGAAVLHLGVETPFAPARKAHPAFVVAGADGVGTGTTTAPAHPTAGATTGPADPTTGTTTGPADPAAGAKTGPADATDGVSNGFEELRARLVAAGHECVDSSGEIEGVVRFHTHDPFGNRLEFQQS